MRDLFALYKTRIWMAQIDSSFEPNLAASMALLTGKRPDFSMLPRVNESGTSSSSAQQSSLNPNAARYVSSNNSSQDSYSSSGPWQYDSQNF